MWIIGITNAFNLLDNMDGLAAGVAALAGLSYLALLLPAGGDALTVAVAAFVGAVLGFLVYSYRLRFFPSSCSSCRSSIPRS
jgi:UDP-GlcNAc:undecaprenyl-phosphate GlcNAc-1-phosphate transferase